MPLTSVVLWVKKRVQVYACSSLRAGEDRSPSLPRAYDTPASQSLEANGDFFYPQKPGLLDVCCRGEMWRPRDPVPGSWEGCLWGLRGLVSSQHRVTPRSRG